MCTAFMYSCSEIVTNGQNRLEDLRRMYEMGCRECSDWAVEELAEDKKLPQLDEVGEG